MDHNSSSRRPHYHRGRRGTDRRGNERRTPQAPEQSGRSAGDQTDVEQIMREIRSRISQRHGIELSPQQIQDLAGRRLEAILDPRTVNPTLFDQLRKGAAVPPDPLPRSADAESSITDDAIYEGGAVVRFFRRLLNPLMKLLFNPAPLVAALQAQTRINRDAAARAVELERRQTEWNALHYQILQRLVTEVSRTSIEMQSLGTRIESLAARVDFNDRRVRTLENTPAATRGQRPQEAAPAPALQPESPAVESAPPSAPASASAPAGDGQRRRRRRRRGRRGTMSPTESNNAPAAAILAADVVADVEEDDDADAEEMPESGEPAAEQLSAQPALSEPAEAPPAPWSPQPQPAPPPQSAPQPAPEPGAVQPELQHVAQRFELSGQVTDRPAAPDPSPAAPSAPGDLPDSSTPDQ